MKVLNVAEKNSAAKNIANLLSSGNARLRQGLSPYNKIYEFQYSLFGQTCDMRMTSVSGHLMNHSFQAQFNGWQNCHPSALFDAPVEKVSTEKDGPKIKKTLEREVKDCTALIIWTDCDREGENIGFEIIDVCKAVKPSIKIYRAKFSEITKSTVKSTIQNLVQPNKMISDAVEVRSELDLRIGASFTRFQTLFLKKKFPDVIQSLLVSFGTCQLPTLGFIVDRYLEIEAFVSEPYWKLKVQDKRDGLCADFVWERDRVFENLPCQALLDECLSNPLAKVENIENKPKSKWRPLPLDTVELQKQCGRKLRLTGKQTMAAAESLYTNGFISYPRTETNIFPKSMNLVSYVSQQTADNRWGNFAQDLVTKGMNPRQGKKTDEAHPPIHPTNYTNALQGNEAKVYEYIVRHFLACLSADAEGWETIVDIDLAGEKFTAKGLQVVAKNYLEVYIYEKWSEKEMPRYEKGQVFRPTDISMVQEATQPPELLTEADLISLMDEHGIGTDATFAEHVDTIKSRHYAALTRTVFLMPGKLGIALVDAYSKMGFQLSKPHLRAELERDLKLICEGKKDPAVVLKEQIAQYRHVYKEATRNMNLLCESMAHYMQVQPLEVDVKTLSHMEEPVFKCPKCGCTMSLKGLPDRRAKFVGCMAFPACKNTIWFPDTVENVEVTDEQCSQCSPPAKKLKFTFKPPLLNLYERIHTACIGGCDPPFNEALAIRPDAFTRNSSSYNQGSNSRRGPRAEVIENPPTNEPRRWGDSQFNTTSVNSSNGSSAPYTNLSTSRDSGWQSQGGPSTSASSQPTSASSQPLCYCKKPAQRQTVRKENANKGRVFYGCHFGIARTCDYFAWLDGIDSQSKSQTHKPPAKRPAQSTGNGSGKRRKCGACGGEGHTRTTCPRNARN